MKETDYKVMPWRCRKWRLESFNTAEEAYNYGMEKGYHGFKVYKRILLNSIYVREWFIRPLIIVYPDVAIERLVRKYGEK